MDAATQAFVDGIESLVNRESKSIESTLDGAFEVVWVNSKTRVVDVRYRPTGHVVKVSSDIGGIENFLDTIRSEIRVGKDRLAILLEKYSEVNTYLQQCFDQLTKRAIDKVCEKLVKEVGAMQEVVDQGQGPLLIEFERAVMAELEDVIDLVSESESESESEPESESESEPESESESDAETVDDDMVDAKPHAGEGAGAMVVYADTHEGAMVVNADPVDANPNVLAVVPDKSGTIIQRHFPQQLLRGRTYTELLKPVNSDSTLLHCLKWEAWRHIWIFEAMMDGFTQMGAGSYIALLKNENEVSHHYLMFKNGEHLSQRISATLDKYMAALHSYRETGHTCVDTTISKFSREVYKQFCDFRKEASETSQVFTLFDTVGDEYIYSDDEEDAEEDADGAAAVVAADVLTAEDRAFVDTQTEGVSPKVARAVFESWDALAQRCNWNDVDMLPRSTLRQINTANNDAHVYAILEQAKLSAANAPALVDELLSMIGAHMARMQT